jgi:hypothetical protein
MRIRVICPRGMRREGGRMLGRGEKRLLGRVSDVGVCEGEVLGLCPVVMGRRKR